MSQKAATNTVAKATNLVPANGVFQRKCACGNHTASGGECTNCAKKKLHRKLSIGASNDPLELEADRVADQVLAYQPAHSVSNISAPKIQRRTEQSSEQTEEVPASVERVLARTGSPLPIIVRKDMEERFGQDFSQVRIHTGTTDAQSAHDINANAYTSGNNIVFNREKFAPETREGKRLLAHELTHVVQQAPSPLASGASYAAHSVTPEVPIQAASTPRISRQPAPTPAPVASPALGFLTPQDIAKLQAFGNSEFRSSLDTLEKMFRFTGDVTSEGLPRQFVSTRQASGELRTFLDFIRNPDIQGVAVVPSASGGRSPDFYYRQVSGAEGRVEVVNITAASKAARAQLRPNKDGVVGRLAPVDAAGSVTSTVEDINTSAKLREAIRVKVKPGSQLSAQNPNTRIAGQPMQTGGEVRVSTSHVELSRAEIDGVIRDLQVDLRNSAANKIVVDTVDAADSRAGRKLFEYVRDPQGTFSFSTVRTSFAKQSTVATVPVAGDIASGTASAAVRALGSAESQLVEHSLEDVAAARIANLTARTAEKDLAETASTAFAATATSGASRQLGKAIVPVIGAAFAVPDAWKGVQDIAHGEYVMGLGTIGVALVDVASQGLHLTDEITAGGGTILAITIQTWAATMQFGFESVRINKRAAELKAYMKTHNNRLPPRAELMGYYKLNDEDILILENDIYKAQQNKVTTEDLVKQVQGLLAQIDANANKPLPEGVTPESIQKERGELSKLLVALQEEIKRNRAQAASERALSDEKRRQTNFDQAQQQQKKPAAQAVPQVLPEPGASQQPKQSSPDPFNLFSSSSAQPLNGISMENAELAATGFGRMRNSLLARYAQLESAHFPSETVKAYQSDVAVYVSGLDRMIAEFKKKGSAEWRGVKEMGRLRDAADNDDRSKLMR